MNNEHKIEERISTMLNRTKNAGFSSPPEDYFENFVANLPLKEAKKVSKINFSLLQNNWLKISSLAVAAVLLLSLWIFVFDADVNKETNFDISIEELLALNDFQNYNDDIIYSELASVSDAILASNEADVDALLDYSDISIDEIIELYSLEDLK